MSLATLPGQVDGQVAPSGAAWPVADLERRLVRALELAEAVIQDFGRTGFVDEVVPQLSFGPEKVIAETAMLVYAAAGATPDPVVQQRVDALIGILQPLCRSQLALAELALNPGQGFRFAVPHVILSRLGRPDPGFDAFVRDRCGLAQQLAAEVPPCARLERQWVLAEWGDATVGEGSYLADTAVGRPLDVLAATREDAYALTHVLFYLSDFGRSAPAGLPRSAEAVLADVQATLIRYLDAGDYDLCAELLMAWPELGAAWGPAPAFAFRVLADIEDAVGVLPCWNVDHARFSAMSASDGQRYARATSYHTGYVMGFLCAVALRRGVPPLTWAEPAAGDRDWAGFADLIDTRGAHWLGLFDDLPDAEKGPLTGLVAGVALVQALERHDYVRVRSVLSLAGRSRMSGPLLDAARQRLLALGRAMEVGAAATRHLA